MARLVPNPQTVLDQLLRLVPHPTSPKGKATGPGTEERILDAALAAFEAQGVRATTMSQIARDAGISREWLYQQFRNRDAIVVAIIQRETRRFMNVLVHTTFDADDFAGAVTEAFVFSIEFLRAHPLLQRVLTSETDALGPRILEDAGPVLSLAVQSGARYIQALGGYDEDRATLVAETIIRIAASAVLAPTGELDLTDAAQLRRYAAAIIPAVLAATPAVEPNRVPK